MKLQLPKNEPVMRQWVNIFKGQPYLVYAKR